MAKKTTDFVSHRLSLSPAQVKKLLKGEATLLKHHQMSGGEIEVHLSVKKHKKLLKNLAEGKGMKLSLDEREREGGNLRGFFKKVGQVAKKVYSGYQKYVKPVVSPLIREGLTKALPMAVGAAATALGQPQLALPAAALAAKVASPLVNRVGDVTGAYGLGDHHSSKVETSRSTFINSHHPAFTPALPRRDMSVSMHGGSFRTMGGGSLVHHTSRLQRHMSMAAAGSPMNPLLPQRDFSSRYI